ncbi:ankyrin repeat domain-containing protein 12-like [Condylostylus longicornis]|uniref:ankyrin repeat domain-containing protein 12-like n=1 Tax=Condylostylus longicornis TaxID=2530218 RepID=UPI00244DC05E|nr:ankyrin repeat domain-containing protein 12-like [Condylostylus longicornis]
MPPPRPRGFAGSSGGSNTRPAPNTPMSERQQMALLMQMTSSAASPSSTSSSEMSPGTMHNLARSRDRNERGETSLHVAAIKGDQDTVKKLLESGVSPNVADFAGWTPLHEACNHAHYNVALTLVKAGANVNARGLDDDTPLHDAATIGHLKLVKMLVEKGADINLKNRKGRTPVDIAHPTVASYLQAVREMKFVRC